MDLVKLRKSKQIKQTQIVSKLKLSSGCVCNWEKGIRTPKIEQLPTLAKILNCSIEELVYAIIATKKGGDVDVRKERGNS